MKPMWITCEPGYMPQDGDIVMVKGRSGTIAPKDEFITKAQYCPEYRPLSPWIDMNGDCLSDCGWTPTHWMPVHHYDESADGTNIVFAVYVAKQGGQERFSMEMASPCNMESVSALVDMVGRTVTEAAVRIADSGITSHADPGTHIRMIIMRCLALIATDHRFPVPAPDPAADMKKHGKPDGKVH